MMQGMNRGNCSTNEAGKIWDVVASLAHALSDARDQLVGLIKHDGNGNAREFQRGYGMENTHRSSDEGIDHHTDDAVAMRCRGGGGCCGNYVHEGMLHSATIRSSDLSPLVNLVSLSLWQPITALQGGAVVVVG
jgi:hypothetical protein